MTIHSLPVNTPEILKKRGLKVVETPGWEKRARPASTGTFAPVGVLCHHTATGPTEHNDDVVGLLVHGRSDLPGPLCHFGLDRDGVVHIIAAGRANHAGIAKTHGTVAGGDGNTLYVGIEAFNNGVGEKWSAKQMSAYNLLVATILHDILNSSTKACAGHKETSVTGKVDPDFDMNSFRSEVQLVIQTFGAHVGGSGDSKPKISSKDEQNLADLKNSLEQAKAAHDGTRIQILEDAIKRLEKG